MEQNNEQNNSDSGTKEAVRYYDLEPIFRRTLQLVELAVSGGLIGGITLTSFSIALSYQFIHCAATRKQRSEAIIDQWTSDPKIVWNPIVYAALAIVDQCPVPDNESAFRDLCFLRDECDLRRSEANETDAFNDSNRAMLVIQSVFNSVREIHGLPGMVVEMAFLVARFKVAALRGDVASEDYLVMRDAAPLVFREYEKILDKGHMALV